LLWGSDEASYVPWGILSFEVLPIVSITRDRRLAQFAILEKNTLSSCRPTGRLDPKPADLAYASLELAALEYRARRGESILLYEDEKQLPGNSSRKVVFR
jgi:hypothetical protein